MATRKTEATEPTVQPPQTIVLADNDPLILEAIGELLRNKGYEVHAARDGLEALHSIRRVKPTYVILDIVMPKIDGSRVCGILRHDRQLRHTPIIALSALSPEQIRRFPALSADAYVAKAPLAVMANNLLLAIKYLDERGRGDLGGGIFGYEGFRARTLISELLSVRQHWDTLMRMFTHGILELDPDGLVLMANAEASRILGKKEVRLIAEPFAPLFSPRDRQVIEEILADLKKSRLAEECRIVTTLGGREVSVRLSVAVEEGECTGFLVTLETGRGEGPVRRSAGSGSAG
jgi:PAS domain S-box-containing protein